MYAIVQIGGHQYRVAEGDVIYVDRQPQEAGDRFTIDDVLMVNNGDGGINIGTPNVDGSSIEATLVEHVKADKVIVFKKKRRKGYKKKRGHRQPMSQIKIESIAVSGDSSSSSSAASTESKEDTTDDQANTSTDLSAKEAIAHIEDTPLEELEGFVTDDESRVTVQRAWEAKQDEE